MKRKWISLCLILALSAGLAGCSPQEADIPAGAKAAYGCQPQGTLSVFDNSYAIAPAESKAVFYKDLTTGALRRADRGFQNAVTLAEGEIVGIGFEDGSLFYARVTADEDGNPVSHLIRADARGENPEIIFTTERSIRQMILSDRLIYFVAYNDEASELWRCNLKGQSLVTVVGGDYAVGDFTVTSDTIYFNMAWADMIGDYSTYRCGISGAGITPTGFRRGGSFFYAGDGLYSAVPYGEHNLLLERLDPEANTEDPYLVEEGGSMVSALWFTDHTLYFSLWGYRNLYKIDLESRKVDLLYEEDAEYEEGEEIFFTGMAMAAGRLVLCDSVGKQYIVRTDVQPIAPEPLG